MAVSNVYRYKAVGGQWDRRGATPTIPEPEPPITLLDTDFSEWPSGVPSVNTWNTYMAGGRASGDPDQLPNHNVTTNPDLGGKMMVVTCKAGIRGGDASASMFVPHPQTALDVTMEMKFKLVSPYDFDLGQKLPGLGGVRSGISAGYPSGGNTVTDQGFSVRGMQATHSGKPDGTGMAYIYGSDVVAAYGEDGWHTVGGVADAANVQYQTGTWITRRLRVRLNDIGSANGIIHEQIDGATVYYRDNRQLRTHAGVLHTHFWWHWFYGGNTDDWAPETDQYIWIDYVTITAAE